jgi:hypothetical protein
MKYITLIALVALSVSSFADVREQSAHRRTEAKRQVLSHKNHLISATPRTAPPAPVNTPAK